MPTTIITYNKYSLPLPLQFSLLRTSAPLILPLALSMAEEAQSRPETDGSKRKLDEIQMAKQKAQEIVARLVNDAEAKRPRLDDASDSESLRPAPPPFGTHLSLSLSSISRV